MVEAVQKISRLAQKNFGRADGIGISSENLTTICVNVRDRACVFVCLFVWMLTPPGRLKVWTHEWYHVVTNSQGHVLSPSGLPKVAKKCQVYKFHFFKNWSQGSN